MLITRARGRIARPEGTARFSTAGSKVDRRLRRAMPNKCGFAAILNIEHGTPRSTWRFARAKRLQSTFPEKFCRPIDFRRQTFVHRTIERGLLEHFALRAICRQRNVNFRR